MTTSSPHDLASLSSRHGERYRWLVLTTVMIGSIASVMSSTIINVAVPDLMRYFSVGQERAQWVAAGFMTATTLAMLPTPWLLARFGYRHAYMGAITLLLIGGIAGGLAGSFEFVLAMRVAEGLAAGVLQTIPAIIVMRAFEPGTQGRAMGIFGLGVVLAPAVGPSVGGLLVEQFGWRSIFFFVVPFGIPALVLAHRYLPISAPGGAAPGATRQPLDFPGLAVASIAILCLLNGLVHLHDANRTTAYVLLAIGIAAFAVFIWRQHRAATPLVNLRIFESRPYAMGSVVAFIFGMGLFGSTYLVPVFMQTALKFPPSEAGAALLPAGLVLAAAIPLAGRLADKMSPFILVAAGLFLLAISFALMATVGSGTALPVLMLWVVVGRIGLGCVVPSLNLGAMRGLDPSLISQGASSINFLRQLGGATGISVVGIFLEWRLRAHAHDLPLTAFHETFWLIAALAAAAMAAALRMRVSR